MAVTKGELFPSAAITVSGATAWATLERGSMLAIGVDITAGSGTVADFDLWVEGSDDDGTTAFAFPADIVQKSTLDGTPSAAPTGTTGNQFVIASKSTLTAERFLAIFKEFPCDRFRVRWTHTGGSSPSLTASISYVAK